jgi:hypothetical protein
MRSTVSVRRMLTDADREEISRGIAEPFRGTRTRRSGLTPPVPFGP